MIENEHFFSSLCFWLHMNKLWFKTKTTTSFIQKKINQKVTRKTRDFPMNPFHLTVPTSHQHWNEKTNYREETEQLVSANIELTIDLIWFTTQGKNWLCDWENDFVAEKGKRGCTHRGGRKRIWRFIGDGGRYLVAPPWWNLSNKGNTQNLKYCIFRCDGEWI
jgi:hypothetical protein